MWFKLAIIALLAVNVSAHAESVISEGIGMNCDEALRNAQYEALMNNNVVMEIQGEYVNSSELNERVAASANHIILGTQVVSTQDMFGGRCKVVARVDISPQGLRSTIESIMSNKARLKNFQKNEFEKREILIVYNENSADKTLLPRSFPAVERFLNLLRTELRHNQFEIILMERPVSSPYFSEAVRQVDFTGGGDVGVMVSFFAKRKCYSQNDCKYTGEVALEMFDQKSKTSLSDRIIYSDTTFGNKNDSHPIAKNLAAKLAPVASQNLSKSVIKYFKVNRAESGSNYTVGVYGLSSKATTDFKYMLLKKNMLGNTCRMSGDQKVGDMRFTCDLGQKSVDMFQVEMEMMLQNELPDFSKNVMECEINKDKKANRYMSAFVCK